MLVASHRNSFSSHHLKTAVQLVDDTLADYDKVLARTQTQRGNAPRIGVEGAAEEQPDVEIFDDTDFYQQLLRDLIDSRGNGAGGSNEDWIAMQKTQKLKKKTGVDTRASKGRKLRCVVSDTRINHLIYCAVSVMTRFEAQEKIQNFMVPVPVPGAWHDEQIDELFVSLLGKGFEEDQDASVDPGGVLSGGFRVFG